MAADLITLAEAEDHVKAGGTAPAAQLLLLPSFISAASALIQCDELAGPVVYVERTATFDGGRQCLVLDAAPVTVLTVTADDTLVVATSYRANASAGTVSHLYDRFPAGIQNVVVTYSVGSLDPVPENIKLACKKLVLHLWQSSRQGASRDTGDTIMIRGYAVPYEVRDLCMTHHAAPGFA